MKTWTWNRVRGLCLSITPDALPDDLSPDLSDVELVAGGLGRKRPIFNTSTLTTGSPPAGNVFYLYTFVTSAGVEEMWAFSMDGAQPKVHRFSSSSWAEVSTSDSPETFNGTTNLVHCVTHNGKLYIAYNTTVNRLHVWDGTSIRRVGLSKPSAPTVADEGSGSYAATARRYRVSFRHKVSANIISESELSEAVSFTPSGSGESARVTKPDTVDHATHWVLWGLIGTSGDTYNLYEELAETAVGTTTFDDSTNPSAYDGDFPATLGLHIPPPSAKFLASDGNRLFMAGAYESSGAADETAPKNDRVWYTRVNGASDIGDDETIPNTTAQKYWNNVGENDGENVRALAGPLDRAIYALKAYSIWQLSATGQETAPFAVFRIPAPGGARQHLLNSQHSTVLAEHEQGAAIYFTQNARIWRLTVGGALQCVNADLHTDLSASSNVQYPVKYRAAFYWPDRAQLWFIGVHNSSPLESEVIDVYTPALAQPDEHGVLRGGWTRYHPKLGATNQTLRTATLFATSVPTVAWLGGTRNSAAIIGAVDGGRAAASPYDAADATNGVVNAYVTSPPRALGGGVALVRLDAAVLQATVVANATPTVSYIRDYAAETRAEAAPSLAAVGSETAKSVVVEGLALSDARVAQIKYAWDSDQYSSTERTIAISVPYEIQEPA